MASIRLEFVQSFVAKGRPYYYFRKPGCARIRLPGLPGSDEFMAAYAAALAASAPRGDIGASRSTPGSIAGLIAAFIGSDDSRQGKKGPLDPMTWRKRLAILNAIREEHGSKQVKGLRREHFTGLLLDGKPPHAKMNWLKTIRPLMAFAIANGWHGDRDLMRDIAVPLPPSDGFKTWDEDQIEAYRATHSLGTVARLAMELVLNTVQRPGDALRLGPQHVRMVDGERWIAVRQSKTGTPLLLPIVLELQEAIDATKGGHLSFIISARGKPFAKGSFGDAFRTWCDAAGLEDFSAHGLRKAGCRRLAEAGATAPEIAAWSGHLTLEMVQHYIAAADQAAMAKAGANKLATALSNARAQRVKPDEKPFENKDRKHG
jgi:integrase